MSKAARFRVRWSYIRCSGCRQYVGSYIHLPLCRRCALAAAAAAERKALNDPNLKGAPQA